MNAPLEVKTGTHGVPVTHRQAIHRLVWRWHFYAGLFCLPFIVWLSITGMIYLFKPQLEPLLERRYAHVTTGLPQAASAQVAAALHAVPGGVLNAYELPTSPGAATRVLIGKGPEIIRVFVDPSSLRVLHLVGESDRFMRVIFYLHGELLLGTAGSMLVELAASWTILMLLSGLYLWWPRQRRLAGVFYPRLGQGSRTFWRDIHAVTGVWVSCFALFLLVSGLPWSKSWGGMLQALRQGTTTHPVTTQDWSIGSAHDRATAALQNAPARPLPPASVPASMHRSSMPGMSMPGDADTAAAGADYTAIDRLLPGVLAQRLAAPVLIAPPSRFAATWTARSEVADRPLRAELVLDGASGAVITRTDFAQHPLLDRIIGYGVAIHEGQLFAPLNQLFGVFTALGMITLSASAVVLWWRRRPAGYLGAPSAHPGVRYPRVLIGLLLLLGVLLPLLGTSMVIVLLLERLVLARMERARRFLGLGASRHRGMLR